MLKKKKKITEEKEESTGGGVKLGKVSFKKAKKKAREEEERKSRRNDNGYYKSPQGRRYLYVIPPTSEAMDGYPTIDKLMHNNLGPEKNGFGQCQGTSLDPKNRKNCRACKRADKYWTGYRQAKKDNDKEEMKKYKDLAMGIGVRAKPLGQIIDVSGAYDKAGKVVDKFPTCFGENKGTEDEKYNKCRRCPFLEGCQLGVKNWELPFAASESLKEKLAEEEVDVTNPNEMLAMKVVRKGEGRTDTKYTITWVPQSMKLPPHVIRFIEKNSVDLSQLVKPSTDEQMIAMLNGKRANDEETNVSNKKKSSKMKEKKNFVKPKVSKLQLKKMREKLAEDSAKKHKKKAS